MVSLGQIYDIALRRGGRQLGSPVTKTERWTTSLQRLYEHERHERGRAERSVFGRREERRVR